MAYLLKW